LESGYYINFIK